MAIYTGTVLTGNDDWYWANAVQNYTSTTLITQYNNLTSVDGVAEADVEIPLPYGAIITAATLHWYDVSYVKDKDATYDGYIQTTSAATWQTIYTFAADPTDATWNSHDFLSTELSGINHSGNTSVRFAVGDPGSTYYRTWEVGAYEGSTDAYLVVEYDELTPTSGAPGYIQSKADNNGAGGSVSVTLDSAPTMGNWLIAALCERSTVPTGSTMTGDGWTYDGYHRIATDDTTYRRGMAIYHKLCASGESSTVEGAFSNELGGATIHVAEFSGLTSFDQIGFTGNGTTANDTSLASSAITTTASTALIAMYGFKCSSNDPSGGGGCSYSDGFDSGASHVSTIIHSWYNSNGWVDAEISGTSGTTITINESTTTNNGIICALMSFNTTLEEEAPVDTNRRARVRFISCD